MKKYIITLLGTGMVSFLLGLFLFVLCNGCTREIEFGNNFDFNVVPSSNVSTYQNVYRDMTVNLTDLIDKGVGTTYQVSYAKITGDLNVSVDNFELIENEFYALPISSASNSGIIKVKAKTVGLMKFKIFLKSSYGKTVEKIVQLNVLDAQYKFDFTVNSDELIKDVFSTFNLNFNITNTGVENGNTYQFKYVSSQKGTLKIGSTVITENEFVDVTEGLTNLTFLSNKTGEHTLTFTVKNNFGYSTEAKVILNFRGLLPVMEFVDANGSVITEREMYQDLTEEFNFKISNILGENTYRIKFETNKTCEIKDIANAIVPLNTYVPISNTSQVLNFTYKYNALQGSSDNIKVTLIDQNNVTVVSNLFIPIIAAPRVLLVNTTSYFGTINPSAPANYRYSSGFAYDINQISDLGSNVTVAVYEFIIPSLNKTYTAKAASDATSSSGTSGLTNFSNKAYTVRFKDSKGRWSPIYNGVTPN